MNNDQAGIAVGKVSLPFDKRLRQTACGLHAVHSSQWSVVKMWFYPVLELKSEGVWCVGSVMVKHSLSVLFQQLTSNPIMCAGVR